MAEIKTTQLPIASNADLGTTDFFLIIDDGVTKRIPRDAVYANIQPLVKGDKGDAGATGATGAQGLRGLQGIQGIKGDTGATGATGSAGATGAQGQKGWSPILATASDGNRQVLQVADWTGGQGTKPATGSYIGSTGLVANIADGVDIRGIQGVKGDTGNIGAAGTNGADGSDARQIAAITHESNNAIRTTFTDTTSVVSDAPKRLLGWASYTDTNFTLSAPFTLSDGIKVTLPNNAGAVINSYLPFGITSFYNNATSKITPATVGDGYQISVRFVANPSTVNTYVSFGIDIGSGTDIFQQTVILPRGAGTPNPVNVELQGYALNTFLANGGLVKLTAVGGNVQIYSVEFQIHRTSVA